MNPVEEHIFVSSVEQVQARQCFQISTGKIQLGKTFIISVFQLSNAG